MDVFGLESAPDDELGGAAGSELPTPSVGSWFQRGSSKESALSDRGIAVPVNAMLDRVREADALTFDNDDAE